MKERWPCAIDPILLEVVRNRLDDDRRRDGADAAARARHSPIVKEGLDASAALFDVARRDRSPRRRRFRSTSGASSRGPAHRRGVPARDDARGRRLHPQRPVRRRHAPAGRRRGRAGRSSTAGRSRSPPRCATTRTWAAGRPGSVPTDATEIFQEGLRIPPRSCSTRGAGRDVLRPARAATSGCPRSSSATSWPSWRPAALGGIRLQRAVRHARRRTVLGSSTSCSTRAETPDPRAIEAIPDGTYRFVDCMDNDGIELDRRVRIEVAVTVRGVDDDVRLHRHEPAGARPVQLRAGLDALGASTTRSGPSPTRRSRTTPAASAPCDVDAARRARGQPARRRRRSTPDATVKRIADALLGAFVPALPGAHAGRQLRPAAGDGVRRTRSGDRPAVRDERARRRRDGRAPGQGRHRRHRDRRDELHEHPGRGARDGLPAPDPARAPLGGLRRRRHAGAAGSGSRRSSRRPRPT